MTLGLKWRACLLAAFTLLSACSEPAGTGEWQTESSQLDQQGDTAGNLLVLGDIDPDTPTRRLQRIRPLADHIALKLGRDPGEVKVKISGSIPEVTDMLTAGEVDVFVDSGYPVLLTSRGSGSVVQLESLVNGLRSYHSVLIAAADSDVNTLADLRGKTIALQERYSTSGFLLPAAHLLDLGFELEYLQSPSGEPGANRIGFFFTGDEENTLAMIREGITTSGVLSSTDYESLPEGVRQEFRVLATTREVPRKLATVSKSLDPALLESLREVLLSISDEDRKDMVAKGGWNWEFLPLDDRSRDGIKAMEQMIDLTEGLIVD